MAPKKDQNRGRNLQKSNNTSQGFEIQRTAKGYFAPGSSGGGRRKGIGNQLTEEIRAIIDQNKDVFLHRLFKAAGTELVNYQRILEGKDSIPNEDGELVQLAAPNLTASILVNQLVLKSLPQVKHIDVSKTEVIMSAIVNLTGKAAVNYLEEKEDLSV